jgi:hypothetical protein
MSESAKDVYEIEDGGNKKKLNKPVLIAAAAGVLGLGVIAASAIGISTITHNNDLMQGKPGQGQFEQHSDDGESFADQGGEQPQFGGDEDGHGRHGDRFGEDRDGDGPHGKSFGDQEGGDMDSDGQFEGENS